MLTQIWLKRIWKKLTSFKELEDFIDKRIAHYDKRKPKNMPSSMIEAIDELIDYLVALTKKYLLLLKGTARLSLVTNIGDWQEIFREPWIPSDNT